MRFSFVALAAIFFVGCGSDSGTTEPKNSATVTASGTSFSPASLTITPGGSVLWRFESGGPHNVTWSGTAPSGGNIGNTSTGDVSRTFGTAGTYSYQCTNHPGMNGTVTVRAASSGGGY